MQQIIIYSKENCPYCVLAKDFFTTRQLPFEEIRIDLDEAKRDEMIQLSNRRTVPQIFINGESIGGYDDLVSLARSGKLEALLNAT